MSSGVLGYWAMFNSGCECIVIKQRHPQSIYFHYKMTGKWHLSAKLAVFLDAEMFSPTIL